MDTATDLTGQITQQALAPPQAPQAQPNPNVQAGLNAVGTGALTPAQLTSQLEGFQKRGQAQEADFQKQFSSMPEAQIPPDSQFHPLPPKDTSHLFSMMMVLGALAGRHTMTPMTAAMNNLTGIMKGQKDGNDAMVAEQRSQFKANFDAALAKAKALNDEKKKTLLEKHHYDTAALQEEYNIFKLQHGIGDSVAKEDMFNTAQTNKMIVDMEKMQTALLAATIKAQTAGQSKLPLLKLPDGTQRLATQEEMTNGLPAGATVLPHGGASKVTMSEEKARLNYNEMNFANQKLNEYDGKGIALPLSSQIFGKLYNPETGGMNSAIQQEIRSVLATNDQQIAFDAALNYTLAKAHAAGGARPSGYQVEMIWNSDIPLATDAPDLRSYKQKVRENAIQSTKMATNLPDENSPQAGASSKAPPAGFTVMP